MKIFFVIFLSIFGISCTSPNYDSKNLKFVVELNKYPELNDADQELWYQYSHVLGSCIQNEKASYESHPMKCEVNARISMAKIYEEKKRKSKYSGSYANELFDVYRNGFINAYVWSYYPQKEWIPPENVKEFQFWASKNLVNHTLQTKLVGKLR